ncbi:MAG: hypothetical protein ABH829_05055 [archaeon]
MHPKLNPSIKFELKGQSFAYRDTASDDHSAKPIDPLAFFICSLCNGENNEDDITSQLRKTLTDSGMQIPPGVELKANVEKVINTLATAGIVMIDLKV